MFRGRGLLNKMGSCKGVNGESVKEGKEKKERKMDREERDTPNLSTVCRLQAARMQGVANEG